MIQSTTARHATLATPASLDDPVEEADHPPPSSSNRPSRRHSHLLRTVAVTLCFFAVLYILPTASAASTERVAAPSSSIPTSVLHSLASLTKRQSEAVASTCACKAPEKRGAAFAVKAAFIPILVVLSGITAGLTLGYMSLDTTQLNVLAKTGTEKQQKAARKVLPLRANGHLLLVTLLVANMIFNETLPIVAEEPLGGGLQATIVSIVLVIIFAEIVPQSVCSRFGLQIGAAMVWPTRILIYIFFVIAWPVSRLLQFLLGKHEGIVYRRAELKELVAMHAASAGHGDLQTDTVTIVGATLDIQAKVVRDAMTDLSNVYSLPITAKLDYETLGKILKSGHSRIPVYEEVPVEGPLAGEKKTQRKIIGVLLTKQLILLDPEDGIPLRDIPISPLPTVSEHLPLLQILNAFQEGRSHMAVVCRAKPALPPPTTLSPIPSLDTTATDVDLERAEGGEGLRKRSRSRSTSGDEHGDGFFHKLFRKRSGSSSSTKSDEGKKEGKGKEEERHRRHSLLGDAAAATSHVSLNKQDLDEAHPVGIITLEDVLEELIGEEILDETDTDETHQPSMRYYIPEEASSRLTDLPGPPPAPSTGLGRQPPQTKPTLAGGIANTVGRIGKGMVPRSRSAPGKNRAAEAGAGQSMMGDGTPVTGSGGGSVAGALGFGGGAFGGARRRSASPGAGAGAKASAPQTTRFAANPTVYAPPVAPGTDSSFTGKPIVQEPASLDHSSAASTAQTPPAPISILRRQSPAASGSTTSASTVPASSLPPPETSLPVHAPTPIAATSAFPRLSDAVLVERGRRKLVAQGANPSSLSAAECIAAAGTGAVGSQPGSRAATPSGAGRVGSMSEAVGTSAAAGGGGAGLATRTPSGGGQPRTKGAAFKSVAVRRPLPQEGRVAALTPAASSSASSIKASTSQPAVEEKEIE
ncbi:hypothetical protein JCM10296v2_004311 [Rhodotorula toruloides]